MQICDIVVTALLLASTILALRLHGFVKGRLTACFVIGFVYMTVLRGLTMTDISVLNIGHEGIRALTLPTYALWLAGLIGLYSGFRRLL